MQAGIAKQGTSYEFTDSCYMDPNCSQGAIILVHPVTKDVFVAMSGACPHLCCAHVDGNPGPAYYAAFPPPMDAGAPSTEAGSSEAGISEAGAESGATDGGPTDGGTHETGSPDAGDSDAGMVMQDVLYCDCHGSIFNALDGTVIQGPAMEPLQLLKTTESGASVLIEIPDNGSTGSGTGPGAP
jgi:Rieske Fe-S protein